MLILKTVTAILPIFLIIGFGALIKWWGLIPQTFLQPANRLVYYIAIPILVFRAISKYPISSQFNISVALISITCVVGTFAIALLLAYVLRIEKDKIRTFSHCSFHGNLGYIGFAIIVYFLGDAGMAKGSIISGLIMITQNLLGVIVYKSYSDQGIRSGGIWHIFKPVVMNPVIISVLLGIGCALSEITIPTVLDRSLSILSGLALPLSLLLIGATLSVSSVKKQFFPALLASVIKLIAMPALLLFNVFYFKVAPEDYLPVLILLAAPAATVTYVFAEEMNGNTPLAASIISLGTILSGFTYIFWIGMTG